MMRRVVLEYNGISDEEFVVAMEQARKVSVFGEPRLWLDRRTVKVKKGLVERIRQVRRELILPASFEGEGAASPCYLLKGEGSRKEGER